VAKARIYRRAKSSMQSGAGHGGWIFSFYPTEREINDPLMGWIGSSDTQSQVALHFNSMEEAIAFARGNGFDYDIESCQTRSMQPKVYADNFRFGRAENWTH
jgi:hypothetical protein